MPCCLPRLLKWKRPVSESLEANGDHTQSLKSHSGLPPKSNVSSDIEFEIPHTNAPTTVERDQSAHRSNDSRESEVVNAHDVDATGFQQDLSSSGTAIPTSPIINKPDKAVHANGKLRRDLWEEAFAQLDKGKKDLLCETGNSHGPNIVDSVAKQTEQIYREHEGRGWEANFKKGFESVLKSVIKYRELIGACLASDPTGHAAAAWAMVSFGLQLAQNELDRRQTILKASEILAENLVLLAAIEASYTDLTVPGSRNLEDVIVAVYIAILELSAEIVHQSSLSSGKRVLNSFTALLENRLQELKDTLVDAQDRLSTWTHIVEQQYRTKKGKDIDEKVDKILAILMADVVTKISILESRALTAEEERILDWYSEYPFFESHRDAMSRRDADTGAWIFESSEYKIWKESGDKVLWLYGNSGCGKSVLCSTIVEDLRKVCNTDSSHVLAYWYFTFGIQESLDADNLRCSIIKQLCSEAHTVPDRAREHWEKHRSEGPKINSDHLSEILDSLVFELHHRGKEIFLVLDALDEYPLLKRREFLLWVQDVSKIHQNVHVLITSRDEIDIRWYLGEGVTLDVANAIIGDVSKFIDSCLSRITQGNDAWKNKYRSRMSERMKGAGERRFRWVALVEQRFSICIDSEMMEDALRDLPETLEGLYEDLLKRIPKDYKEKARLILMWLTYSSQPLTLQELASAVAISNPLKVLEVCNSSLVSLQRDGDRSLKLDDAYPYPYIRVSIVKLDHFSVKEYLLSERLLASVETGYFHVDPPVAHLTIAETSVSHIINTNDVVLANMKGTGAGGNEDQITERDRLLWYSMSWFKHTKEADAFGTSMPGSTGLTSKARSAEAQLDLEVLRIKCHRLFCSEYAQSYRNWCYLLSYLLPGSLDKSLWEYLHDIRYSTINEDSPGLSPIFIASLLGMVDNVRRLLDDGVNVDGNLHTRALIWKPVQAAAIAGNLKGLIMLLERGASFDQSDLDVVARYNLGHGADVLMTILQSRQDLAITDDTVQGFASNTRSPEMLDYVLDTKDVFTLTQSMLMTLLQSRCMDCWKVDLVEKILSRFWFMIRHSKNILITQPVTSRLAKIRKYNRVIFSLLMDHGNCNVNDFDGLEDFQIVPRVEEHMRTCAVDLWTERKKVTPGWNLIRYSQDHARPNVTFAKALSDAEPSNSNT